MAASSNTNFSLKILRVLFQLPSKYWCLIPQIVDFLKGVGKDNAPKVIEAIVTGGLEKLFSENLRRVIEAIDAMEAEGVGAMETLKAVKALLADNRRLMEALKVLMNPSEPSAEMYNYCFAMQYYNLAKSPEEWQLAAIALGLHYCDGCFKHFAVSKTPNSKIFFYIYRCFGCKEADKSG